jgi:hypothetical protein
MRRQLSPTDYWHNLNTLTKGQVYLQFLKLIPQKVHSKHRTSVHDCTLVVFKGRIHRCTRDDALRFFHIKDLARSGFKRRSIKALFWPDCHTQIDEMLKSPGRHERLRLFNGALFSVYFDAESIQINTVDDEEAVALILKPDNHWAWLCHFYGRLLERFQWTLLPD